MAALTVFHPCGTAGGEQRQVLTGRQPLQKLSGLLHDRQVGTVGGVIDLGKAQPMEYADQLAHNVFTLGEPERLAYCHTDRRGNLSDDLGVPV